VRQLLENDYQIKIGIKRAFASQQRSGQKNYIGVRVPVVEDLFGDLDQVFHQSLNSSSSRF
jgi:hypothetical protein